MVNPKPRYVVGRREYTRSDLWFSFDMLTISIVIVFSRYVLLLFKV